MSSVKRKGSGGTTVDVHVCFELLSDWLKAGHVMWPTACNWTISSLILTSPLSRVLPWPITEGNYHTANHRQYYWPSVNSYLIIVKECYDRTQPVHIVQSALIKICSMHIAPRMSACFDVNIPLFLDWGWVVVTLLVLPELKFPWYTWYMFLGNYVRIGQLNC